MFFDSLLDTLRQTHAQWPWFFTVCFGILGALVGSFLNVCAMRLPRGESIVTPGSHCDCGVPIPLYLNVPIFSWLILRGRAACCGRRFGVRHPLVEVLTAALFALCWALLPWERALAGMCFCSMLTVLALIDFDTQLLPDALNIALAAVGLLFSAVLPALHEGATQALWLTNSLNGIGTSLVGIFVGAGLVYWLRLLATLFCGREALGEGDIILLGGIGAFCGWRGAVFALFGGALLGAVVLSPFVLAKKICRRRIDNEQHPWAASLASCEGDETAEFAANNGFEDEVPFGPWLAIGAVAWFLYFRHPFALWLDNFSGTLVGRRTQSRADCMDATRM